MFFDKGQPPSTEKNKPLMKENKEVVLKGRVVECKEENAPAGFFVGAMKLSNNTAEMQAIVEGLLFILAQVEEDEPAFAMGSAIIIHSDSRYAVDLIKAGSRSRTNFLLRDFLHHMWKKGQRVLRH